MAAPIAHWIFLSLLAFIGLYLTLLGGYLVYIGGSFYYVTAGIAVLATARMVKGRDPRALPMYGSLLGVTLVWSLYEADGYVLTLLPRLGTWMGLGLWFFTPWYRQSLRVGAPSPRLRALPWIGAPLLACALVLLTAGHAYEKNSSGTQRALPERMPITDWRQYGNTDGGTRFAEIEQINTQTVGQLKEVWRYRTGVSDDFKMTPLQVNGLLYLCASGNVMMAVDSESGKEVWRHDPQVVHPAKHQYAKTCRGLSYYEAPAGYSGQCPKRIVTATVDARLIAVDAMTGERCTQFGLEGSVDLRKGLSKHYPDQYYVTSPPLVADDVLVVGGLVLDSQDLGLPSGVVRAFDALTGTFAWAWDLGNPGYYGEPKPGETYTPGTPNVWSIMSYDAELDLIFAPTGNASPDYYGGERRPYDDEWSSAVVALDAGSGEPRWKYQTVHHDIWDYDLPAQPVLVDVDREGERIPAVAVPTKMGDIFLLDRRDGTQVFPMQERAAPQAPEYGEYLSPTQPVSALPNFHPYLHEKDMWGLTPLDQLACRIEYRLLRYEGMYTPPTAGGTLIAPGNFGGFNWGSVSVDADNGLLVAAPMLLAHRLILFTPEQVAKAGPIAGYLLGKNHPAVRMDPDAPIPEAREPNADDPYDHARIRYYGMPQPFMARLPTGVPCFEPPWSRIAVIDLNTRELLWSRPLGSMKDSGPFGLRSGLPFDVGVAVRAGTLTTRGGLTFVSSTMDRTVRAFDLRTGEIKWSQELPGSSQSTPMTYLSEQSGKQFLIVTIPNPSWRYPRDPKTGTYTDSASIRDGKGGYVIAYAIPER
ncbi:PQQ-binding-like beta-propeller repeat protein [Pseudomaricurvus alkylphenolicus]|uniref:outer membrane protein assembly factor BamB family protein n=1 Tax=Pseudomaricurvus alkylphenolicus TaxID=1306991 RepID=UPI0014247A07|nr:PQQ-binding-like beta-propeller repeat protein [Pseudomaricurvus alkylphenolicus]NIB43547.1 PQQ-binding-like beta-propeller repeat protein [Pseudomaricurvus alkylphenolicus]